MTAEKSTSTEAGEATISEIEYPYEYFDAQVRFAMKWSEISQEPISKTFLKRTDLYRCLTNERLSNSEQNPLWRAFA
ncbi:MAG TPA: hypothetical protein VNZ45_18875, partial [Bacteroidia bacterium]|nr:hypothetical protein [Bacteroidia bacterium]